MGELELLIIGPWHFLLAASIEAVFRSLCHRHWISHPDFLDWEPPDKVKLSRSIASSAKTDHTQITRCFSISEKLHFRRKKISGLKTAADRRETPFLAAFLRMIWSLKQRKGLQTKTCTLVPVHFSRYTETQVDWGVKRWGGLCTSAFSPPSPGFKGGFRSGNVRRNENAQGCSIVQYCLLHSRLMQRQTPVASSDYTKSNSLSPKLTGDSERNSA